MANPNPKTQLNGDNSAPSSLEILPLDESQLTGPTNVKKRVRKEKTSQERPSKRVKTNASANAPTTVKISLAPSQAPKETKKGEPKKGVNEKRSIGIPKLKWKTLQPIQQPVQPSPPQERQPRIQTRLRPRIWASNREELLATLPEMAGSKCFNGLSWELYETPILLLDDRNINVFQIRREGLDSYTLDLVTTRSFICPKPMEAITEDVPMIIDPPQHNAKTELINDGVMATRDTLAASSEGKVLKKKRKTRTYPSPKPQGVGVVPQGISEAPLRIDFAAPLPMYTVGEGLPKFSIPPNFPGKEINSEEKPLREGGIPKTSQVAETLPPSTTYPYVSKEAATISGPMGKQPLQSTHTTPPTISPSAKIASSPATVSRAATRTDPISQTTMRFPSSKFSDTKSIDRLLKNAELILSGNASIQTCDPQRDPPAPITPLDIPASDESRSAGHPHPKKKEKTFVKNHLAAQGVNGSADANPLDQPPVVMPRRDTHSTVVPRKSTAYNLASDTISTPIPVNAAQPKPPLPAEHPISEGAKEPPNEAACNATAESQLDTPSIELISKDARSIPNDGPQDAKASQARLEYVPSPIPGELQAIIDAYLFGKPLTLIISRELLYDHWSLLLPKDIGYVMMGYFSILGVQEILIRVGDPVGAIGGQLSLSGQVEWRFRLRWAPGGEEFIMPKVDPSDLEDPWWKPPYPPSPRNGLGEMPLTTFRSATMLPKEPEDDFPSTPRYRQARISHHEYKFRHNHFRELYESLLPTYLLAPFGRLVRDLSFPRGWFCQECGKVNFQAALRHRYCTSSSCKERPPPVEPYALTLFLMRDPQDRLPVSFPYNTYPKSLEPQIRNFEDGTRTITYELRDDMRQNPYIKHVFTGNHPPLQHHATTLLKDIQLNVELVRPFSENTPYFVFSARCPKDNASPTDMEWENVPRPINSAKKVVVDRAREFAGLLQAQLSINHLKLLAWVTSGTKKSPDILRAKEKAILILSLGCDVALTLIPRSIELCSAKGVLPTDNHCWNLLPLKEHELEEDGPLVVSPDMEEGHSEPPVKTEASKKQGKPAFVLTLVHGDMAVLFGAEFDYSIKRDGTSFLLIASHEDES